MTPKLVVIGGSIGTGKTTLAYKLKKYLEEKTGTECFVLESDTERREYLGYPIKYRMEEVDYSSEINQKIYQILDDKVSFYLLKNHSVVRTLTGQSTTDYYKTQKASDETGAEFIGIFLVASEKTIRERLLQREHERNNLPELSVEKGHAADADAGVLLKYPIPDYIPDGWVAINAEQTPDNVYNDAIKALGL